jgi:hypothetical protein
MLHARRISLPEEGEFPTRQYLVDPERKIFRW